MSGNPRTSRVLRVYIDTSVVGGCLDDEFAADSRRIFGMARSGRLILLLSDVVVAEIEPAPANVKRILDELPERCIRRVPISTDVAALRDAYLLAEVVGVRSADDATHVAAATVARADAILSWNFKHIVHLDRIKQYNQVNLANGYGMITILSPKDMTHVDEDDEVV